jgi:hypothetical protein
LCGDSSPSGERRYLDDDALNCPELGASFVVFFAPVFTTPKPAEVLDTVRPLIVDLVERLLLDAAMQTL